jgi:hypothetical protein
MTYNHSYIKFVFIVEKNLSPEIHAALANSRQFFRAFFVLTTGAVKVFSALALIGRHATPAVATLRSTSGLT